MQEKKVILSPVQKILGEDFNPGLLMIIARKSLIWCVLIILLTMSSSLLYLRYTMPMFEVSASLMIKQENTSVDLGLGTGQISENQMDQIEMQKNIQIMKSNVILDRVIDLLPLQISYYNLGQILVEERYKTSPFEIIPTVTDQLAYDNPIFFTIKTARDFEIEYRIAKQKFNFKGQFNQKTITPHFNFVAKLTTTDFRRNSDIYLNSNYYFQINSRLP